MTAAPQEDWRVSRLAGISGVSPAHFARSFKRAFGVPPHRYLLTVRLERAKALLGESTLPITEIALSCGWTSVGTFGRTFRDVIGDSPSGFRDKHSPTPETLAPVPTCVLRAAARPDLTLSVLEKRRHDETG